MPLYGDNENSSCSSCIYTSGSDRSTLRRLIAERSRIDRLVRENDITSKDIKLINKLVRTRALYDDVRNRLLSGSSISVNEKAVLKPVKFNRTIGKKLEEAERSSDIFAMIGLVDKGVVLGPRKLNQCCSCGSCSSKARSQEHDHKCRKQKCPYTSGNITSNSSVVSKGTIEKHVRFKTKNIKSEPCTCTSKDEQIPIRQSKIVLRRNLPTRPISIDEHRLLGFHPIEEHTEMKSKEHYYKRKSYQKYLLKSTEGEAMVRLANMRTCTGMQDCRKSYVSLDKDVQTKVNTPLLTALECFLRSNIKSPESIMKPSEIHSKNVDVKHTDRRAAHLRKQFLIELCSKLGLDRAKLNYLYGSKKGQGLMISPDSIKPEGNIGRLGTSSCLNDPFLQNYNKVNVDTQIQVKHSKYKISAKHSNIPLKTQIESLSALFITNLGRNDSKLNLNYGELRRKPLNDSDFSGRKGQHYKRNVDNLPRKRCMYTSKPKKYKSKTTKHNIVTQESTFSKHSPHSRNSRILSAPNVRVKLCRSQASFHNETTSVHSIEQGKKNSSMTRISSNIVKISSSNIDILPGSLTKDNYNSMHESIQFSKSIEVNTKRLHTSIDTKILQQHTLSQESSITMMLHHTTIMNKLHGCLCKLKLVKPLKKSSPMKVQRVYPHRSDLTKQKKCTKPQSSNNKSLHKIEPFKLCDDECVKNSVCHLKCRSVSPPKSRRRLSLLPNKSEVAIRDSERQSDGINSHRFGDKIQTNCTNVVMTELSSQVEILPESKVKNCKLPMLKLEKKGKGLSIRPAMKRCFCTLKFHKKAKNSLAYDEIMRFKKNKSILNESSLKENKKAVEKLQVSSESQLKICTLGYRKAYNSNNLTQFTPYTNRSVYPSRHRVKEKSLTNKLSVSTIEFESKRTQSYLRENNYKLLRLNSDKFAVNRCSKEIFRFESKFSFQMNSLKSVSLTNGKTSNPYELLFHELKPENCGLLGFKEAKIQNKSQLTGIQPLLRRCYCTMNIHIANHGHKLEPYECEPGVGIPYECDPIECQKLIMKRLMKNTSTMSDTHAHIKPTSNSTKNTGGKAKKQQSKKPQAHRAENKVKHTVENQGKYPTQRHENMFSSVRQAVRVGSSFNFDIEFSKHLHGGMPTERVQKKSHKPSIASTSSDTVHKKNKTQRTKGASHKRHDMESQSTKLNQKSSGVGPMMKRCFCTLKLQKMGKQHIAPDIHISHGTSTPTNMNIVPVAKETSQNTKLYKGPKLLDYECEPGICVPGECDPHACLELIHKRQRKTKGTNSMRADLSSTSSMTPKHKTKTKGKHTQPYKMEKQKRKKSRAPAKSAEIVVKQKPEKTSIAPSRQAVRIGSSFSFNIQFYKDLPPKSDHIQLDAHNIEKQHHTKSHHKKPKTHAGQSQSGLKTKEKGLSGRNHDVHTQDTQAAQKKHDKALAVGPMLKRCFCTLKLQKHKEIGKTSKKGKVLSANHSTATHTQKPVPDLHTRGMMAAQKSKSHKNKLLPYECEPGICVPGSCDPHECYKLIQKRLMKDSAVGTKHSTKSVKSSVKKSHKHKDSHSQKAEKHKKPHHKDTAVKNLEAKKKNERMSSHVSRPGRQAVKIGSSFSFDIQFTKDKSAVPNFTPHDESVISKSPPKVNKEVQRKKTTHDTDSQVKNKMRSTKTGGKPILKRCFCTLKLQKNDNIKPAELKAIATETQKNKSKPKIDAMEKGTKTKKGQIHSPVLSPHTLLPYECEPGVCIPGECDPHECLKRIQKRESHSKKSGTDKHKGWSKSNSVEDVKESAKKTQVKKEKKVKKETHKKQHHIDTSLFPMTHIKSQKSTPSRSPSRQAVRIGSSFNFNIEFYKDSGGQAQPPCDSVCEPICKPPKCQQECYSDCHKTTDTKTKGIKSTGTHSKDKRLHNKQAITNELRTESKGSGVKPSLKRCFCTIKLQKMGHFQQQKNKKINANPKHVSTSPMQKKHEPVDIVAKEVATRTKKVKITHDLLPYECEPGICVPGECNPHECLKKKKERETKNAATVTTEPPKKSASIDAHEETKIISTKTQIHKEGKKDEPLKKEEVIKREQVIKKKVKKRVTCECPEPDSHRQAVRIGSNFSFNIEFYKDRSLPNALRADHKYLEQDHKHLEQKGVKNKHAKHVSTGDVLKSKNKGSVGLETHSHHRKIQAAHVKTESKGSGMAPLLKRCFCTLTLQKASGHLSHVEKMKKVKNLPPPPPTSENKSTSTKKKHVSPKYMHLEPYECEPGVCVPGECNPYACLERIKKRGIERKNQTDKSDLHTSKLVQYDLKKQAKFNKQANTRTQKEKKHVERLHKEQHKEQPRFPIFADISNRQAVKICSNFNFNIEFCKDTTGTRAPSSKRQSTSQKHRSEELHPKNTKCVKKCAIQTVPKKTKCEKKCGFCDNAHSCQSQSDLPKTENKSSSVGKVLKRCFCTAKLNKHLVPPQNLTVSRVENVRNTFPFSQQSYWVQYQTRQIFSSKKLKEKSFLPCKHCRAASDSSKNKSESKRAEEMETILPYNSNKFNKKKSCSKLRNSTDEQKNIMKPCHKDNIKKPNLKGVRRLTIKKSSSDIMVESGAKTEKSLFKKILCRFMHIFSKNKTNFQDQNDNLCKPTCNKEKLLRSFIPDYLNSSKSERQSRVIESDARPKKSKSLKSAKLTENTSHKKKKFFSKYQSGDGGHIQMPQKLICLRCEPRYNEVEEKAPTKFVHFASKLDECLSKLKTVCDKNIKDNYNTDNVPCITICSSCGGFHVVSVGGIPDNTATSLNATTLNSGDITDLVSSIRKQACMKERLHSTPDQNKSCRCTKCCCPKKTCKCKGKCLCPKPENRSNKQSNNRSINQWRNLSKYQYQSNNGSNAPYRGQKCICGSPECSEDAERLKREYLWRRKQKPPKPCVCGSNICGAEALKSEKKKRRQVCECSKSLKRSKASAKKKEMEAKRKMQQNLEAKKKEKANKIIKKKLEERKRKAFILRQKRFQKEDGIRRKKRRAADKTMLKQVKKYKNSGDFTLITESALDIAKLGLVSAGDILRTAGKAAIDPKHTCRKVKSTMTEPSQLWAKLKSTADNSPGIATAKRVRMRLRETSCAKKGKETLESFPATHFMLHMGDKEPKKRIFNKPKKKRLKIDFQCSPYMLSLRKRPAIAVYLACPWFYPHCMSLLTVWRQFTDILLFLLAVAVWSPCIFCMEACRALMCCFLCTG